MRVIIAVAIFLLGSNAVLALPHTEENPDGEELLKRLLRVLGAGDKKPEHRSVSHGVLDELEEQLIRKGLTCKANEEKCRDGTECFPKEDKCNKRADCHDASDELGCDYGQETCSGEKISCADKKKCIHRSDVCDGFDDCNNGSDEKDCQNYQCVAGMERCAGSRVNRQCVLSAHFCDGYPDCENGYDEKNCKQTYTNQQYIDALACKSDEITCGNGKCLWKPAYECDGEDDCGDGTDEKNCPKTRKSLGVSENTKNKILKALLKRLVSKK